MLLINDLSRHNRTIVDELKPMVEAILDSG